MRDPVHRVHRRPPRSTPWWSAQATITSAASLRCRLSSSAAAELELIPDIGEDPVRALARLPGVASQDFSSRAHLRGGTPEETLFRFDDLRLYNPYHLKDFFGVFSSIDPGIVSDIRVYTGGFPVAFGDRSSGVVDIAPRLPARDFQGRGGRVDDDDGRRARRRLRGGRGRLGLRRAAREHGPVLRPRRFASRRARIQRLSTPTSVVGSTTGSRSPPMRSPSTTGSSPSTATRKKRRAPSTRTATTGSAPTLARRTASAVACSQARRASQASVAGAPTCRASAAACSRTAATSRSTRSRPTGGGASGRARSCRRGSSGASKAVVTTTRMRPSSSSCS